MEYLHPGWRSEPSIERQDHDLYVRFSSTLIWNMTDGILRLHLGKTNEAETFEDYLGEGDYETCIVSTFDDYLDESFRTSYKT